MLRTAAQAREWVDTVKKREERICLVPTMGYFHAGHLSLMRTGREYGDRLVVSLFVNPAQFGENEDLAGYPVDISRDLELAGGENVDAVFMPDRAEMYPEGFQTYVELTALPAHLCGLSRPVHFRGVATIVAKLFNILRPDTAVFGRKDYQQLQVIRRMVKDLNYHIQIVGAPIVREQDGLAMSSRNTYLSSRQRTSAVSLSKALAQAAEKILDGTTSPDAVENETKAFIRRFPETAIDYVKVCDPATLARVTKIDGPVLIALAVKIGGTRLIDNRIVNPAQ